MKKSKTVTIKMLMFHSLLAFHSTLERVAYLKLYKSHVLSLKLFRSKWNTRLETKPFSISTDFVCFLMWTVKFFFINTKKAFGWLWECESANLSKRELNNFWQSFDAVQLKFCVHLIAFPLTNSRVNKLSGWSDRCGKTAWQLKYKQL